MGRLCCNAETLTDRTFYKDPVKQFSVADAKSSIRIGQLIQQTNPDLLENYQQRLQVEAQIKRDPLELNEVLRAELIREPFALLSYDLEHQFQGTRIDMPLLIAIVISVAICIGIGVAADQFLQDADHDLMPLVIVSLIAVAAIAIIIQAVLVKGRYVRKVIHPLLRMALRPLRPTAPEIEKVLVELHRQELLIAKHTKTAQLLVGM